MDVLVVVVIGVAIVAALLWLVTANPWLSVSQTLTVPSASPASLYDPIYLLLSNISGAEVQQAQPGSFALVVRRTPGWVLLPLVITFPLGLLFLMVKQSGSLLVTLEASGANTRVRMVGKTKQSVVKTLAKAFGSLGARVSA